MDSKIKELIAEKKLSDEEILNALKQIDSENPSESKEMDESEATDASVEEHVGDSKNLQEVPDNADENSENSQNESPAVKEDEIARIVDERLATALKGLRKGKTPPKPKKEDSRKHVEHDFGAL
jgi:hypothetical protein